ncbi:hypothetical protein XH99_21335 [Bradyrhizobium nanningense]|uniref:Uncharacterized protein n=1 Tax=Bradyrhizobium nanningense TaxID=1325118 RepID=A0A4Q0S233_9BRAD|nr:hypothetical protein XH99_21335 [Bradyrhizobium nanningense]RXH33148.1 hypothetical protein XH84_10850 [Bradyrhizobium nanningense]
MRWRGFGSHRAGQFRAVNEFIGLPRFAAHDRECPNFHHAGGFDQMRKRLIAWTILTSALVAVGVWTVLGPPAHPSGTHLPSRTAAVR